MENFDERSDLFKQVAEIVRKQAESVKRKSKKLDCPFVVECFECGKSFMIADELQRSIYDSSGMCESCEQKALGEYDPVMAKLESIEGRLDRIEKLLRGLK
mgnify:CR=1 FL=1